MKEIKVYLFTEDEATEILQNILDLSLIHI